MVKSSRDGVEEPVERQVVEIIEKVNYQITKEDLPIDRYKLEDEPYEVDIIRGEISNRWLWHRFW